MKKIVLLLFCTFVVIANLAQAPQGFSYQAVIRNTDGQPLESQSVSIRLTLQNEDATTVHYSETHSFTTSPHGLVSLTVGNGTPENGTFSAIPWDAGSIFLKVEVDTTNQDNFALLGISLLQSVPYALYAASGGDAPEISGTGQAGKVAIWVDETSLSSLSALGYDNNLEVISPPTAGDDDPILEVKNREGQVVLGVYQTGVRIYVEDVATKSTRSGFAIGGLTEVGKEEGPYLLQVNRDGTTIRFDDENSKSTRSGFAIGGLTEVGKALENDYLTVTRGNTTVRFDEDATKSTRSGFAIGGLTDVSKESDAYSYMSITPENYFIGHQAGSSTTTGQYNSFFGYEAGKLNTEGRNNIFMGFRSGEKNTLGGYNAFLGNYTGSENTSGYSNVFIGDSAGKNNTTGSWNIFMGKEAGKSNLDGQLNIFMGEAAGFRNTSGRRNIFLGTQAGYSNTDGMLNIFIGVLAGARNTTGIRNVFIGQGSGYMNNEASYNVFIGDLSGTQNLSGEANVFVGRSAGFNNILGSSNVYVGEKAAYYNQEGSGNVFIGRNAGMNELGSNKLYISNTDSGTPLIYGEFDENNLEIFGTLKINEVLNLKPRSSAPGNPEIGDVFYDSNSNSIKFFNGSEWMELNATPVGSTPIFEILDVQEEYLLAFSCKVLFYTSSSSSITAAGVLYHTEPFFDMESGIDVPHPSPGVGELTVDIEDLTEATQYYLRSYATNASGTALSDIITFTTLALPKVSTKIVTNIQQTTATAAGEVTDEGGAVVTERGVCWSLNPSPNIDDNKVPSGSGAGAFTCDLTSLTTETTYYVKAYATSSLGTSYGAEVIFTTAPPEATVDDSDGNTYNIVQIGTQTWMGENLKTTKYRNGDLIPNIAGNSDWEEITSGAFCWYNNDEVANRDTYGALYNFYAVDDDRNLCPGGWHVPTYSEWTTLVNYLGGQVIAGMKLKEEGTEHWASPNEADNTSGFTALPGGFRVDDFESINYQGRWWSSEIMGELPTYIFLINNSENALFHGKDKHLGFSVRCIKD